MKSPSSSEPRLRILNVSIPWYRLSRLMVPYSRWHIVLYLLTLVMLTIGAGGLMIFFLGFAFGLPEINHYLWMLPLLGLGLWCNHHGREQWYFGEIERVASDCSCPPLTREVVQLQRQAQQILHAMEDVSTAPAERQTLRMELKNILCKLARTGYAEEVRVLHERAPYLKLTA